MVATTLSASGIEPAAQLIGRAFPRQREAAGLARQVLTGLAAGPRSTFELMGGLVTAVHMAGSLGRPLGRSDQALLRDLADLVIADEEVRAEVYRQIAANRRVPRSYVNRDRQAVGQAARLVAGEDPDSYGLAIERITEVLALEDGQPDRTLTPPELNCLVHKVARVLLPAHESVRASLGGRALMHQLAAVLIQRPDAHEAVYALIRLPAVGTPPTE